MKKHQMAMSALALALPLGAFAAGPQQTSAPLMRPGGASPQLGVQPIEKPQLKRSPASRVSQMRAVPGADGTLHIVCAEVPNPKLRQAQAGTGNPLP